MTRQRQLWMTASGRENAHQRWRDASYFGSRGLTRLDSWLAISCSRRLAEGVGETRDWLKQNEAFATTCA